MTHSTDCVPGTDTTDTTSSTSSADSSSDASSTTGGAGSVTPASIGPLGVIAPAGIGSSTSSSTATADASANASANAGAAAGTITISPGTINPAAATQQHIVGLFYQGILNRVPDAGGEAFWMADLRNGQPLPQIGDEFLACAEPQSLGFGTMSNQQFVTTLYAQALGRAPEAAGFTAWTNDLAAGASRGAVVAGICDSPEAYAHEFAQNASVYPI